VRRRALYIGGKLDAGGIAMPTDWCRRLIAGCILATAVTSADASLVGDLRPFLGNPDTIGPALRRLGARSIEFPITSTTPGLIYDYDPQRGTFTLSNESLGPVFVERAETVGAGRLSVAFTYQYGDFDQFDGNDFIMKSTVSGGGEGGGNTIRTLADISIPINQFAFSATYGITDEWDVNLFLPLLYSRLRLNTQQSEQSFGEGPPNGPITPLPPMSFNEGSFGVGDVLLRTKYRLGYVDDFGFALGLVLGVPTGNPSDFRGTGDWRVEPVAIVSRNFGRNNVHMSAGMDFDAASFNRTQAHYALGILLEPLQRCAFLLDFLGTSDLQHERFTADFGIPPFNGTATGPFLTGGEAQDGTVVGFYDLPRFDRVNVAVGFEFALFDHGAAYVNAVFPLTTQVLRAKVIPSGGITYRFD
jgi:hypothetical protein